MTPQLFDNDAIVGPATVGELIEQTSKPARDQVAVGKNIELTKATRYDRSFDAELIADTLRKPSRAPCQAAGCTEPNLDFHRAARRCQRQTGRVSDVALRRAGRAYAPCRVACTVLAPRRTGVVSQPL
jgi:hypothetical protein